MSNTCKKHSVLSSIGSKAYKTLASLVAPEIPREPSRTRNSLVKLMEEHLSPKPPVIVQRFRFHSRVMQATRCIPCMYMMSEAGKVLMQMVLLYENSSLNA